MSATYSPLFEKYEGFPKLRESMKINSFAVIDADLNTSEHPLYQGNIHILGSRDGLIDWNATPCTDDCAKHIIKGKEYGIEVWPERRQNFMKNEHNNNIIKRYIAEQIVEFDEDIPTLSELQ